MFNLSYTTESECKGTIKGRIPYGLGPYTDANGGKWDIRGYGKDSEGWWCWAVPSSSLHPYYTDTSGRGFGFVSQTWEPYRMEIVDENRKPGD